MGCVGSRPAKKDEPGSEPSQPFQPAEVEAPAPSENRPPSPTHLETRTHSYLQAAQNGPHPPVAAVELALPTPPTARNSTVPEPLTDDTTASGEPVQVTENSETSAADPSSRLFSEGDTGLPSILPAEHEQPQAWPMSDGVMPVNDDDDNNDNDVPRDSLVSRPQSQEGPGEAPLGDPDARVPLDEADPLHAAEMELLQLASEVAPIHELAEIQTPVDMHLTGKTMDFLDEVVASRKSCASPDDEGVMTETA